MIKKRLQDPFFGDDEYLPVLTRKKQNIFQRLRGWIRGIFKSKPRKHTSK